jgi:hypothetical protein
LAAYNGILLALVPYLAFRRRYSHQALNLKSGNLKNDFLVIVVVLLISCLFDLAGTQYLPTLSSSASRWRPTILLFEYGRH